MAEISSCPPLTRESVVAARQLILPLLPQQARFASRDPSELGEKWQGRKPAAPKLRLWFKCENFQRGGAFKARGAFHALERLKMEPGWAENGGREKGVATHSSGNHAQALALAAKENGIPAHIVMPSVTTPYKVNATKGFGANVIFSTLTDRLAVAERVVAETGARMIPPYDHPDIILGQGTMGLELQEQIEHLDAIMAPCSGGGMLSGVALSCEGTGIKVFGAEPEFEGADDAKRGMEQGKRITNVNSMSIADGLRSYLGVHPWSVLYERKLVQGMYAVSEEEIKAAMKLVLERMKLVIEPSAAVPLAVEAGDAGWDLGLILSGGNIAVDGLAKLFAE
ncbi:tryptophan synthase beta subunit-like PLP-dependent enzyme [Plectosphaerella cucumerina]|uniref:Tryptophan synthase beta subunit-like PLP-dependent enzyme n=1 Tax=Plectosphaerella cucumerina TaxID=40658 RepID=A0A8K0TKF3_9PEZI|nr:tryptophan synthase beta subunit-like PLP-dependent enzyme [Plectosphaerella cucumerina]